MMVSDGSGSGQIEVDGVMSRPSDPMLCNTENVCVSAPIAFSVRKTFWKNFWEMVGQVGQVGQALFLLNNSRPALARLSHLIASKSARATLSFAKNKNPQKNL